MFYLFVWNGTREGPRYRYLPSARFLQRALAIHVGRPRFLHRVAEFRAEQAQRIQDRRVGRFAGVCRERGVRLHESCRTAQGEDVDSGLSRLS